MEKITFEDIESEISKNLITSRESFEILALSGRMDIAVKQIERTIESLGFTCRIYTKGRVAAAGASLFGGVTGVVGIASAIGMAAHNLATYDPDFEVIKHRIDNKLSLFIKNN